MRLTDEEVRQTLKIKSGQTIDHIAHYERHTKVRILTPGEKKHKKCVQLHKDGSEIKWTKPEYDDPIPLYGIDSLKEGQPVFYVEGEQKVQALRDLGLSAVTAGGANEVDGADFAPLKGYTVRIWPDNDKAGHEAANLVAKKCHAAGAKPLKVVVRQGPKEDVVDYLRENPRATASDILQLQLIDIEQEFTPIFRCPPLPIPSRPKVPEMKAEQIPEALRAWALDEAERKGCPLEMIVVPLVVRLSAIPRHKLIISPKQEDDWLEPAPLWGGVVADPGSKKSPAIKASEYFTRPLEEKAKKKFADAKHEYEINLQEYKIEIDGINKALKEQKRMELEEVGNAEK